MSPAAWPSWLVPLVDAFAEVTAEQLSRHVPPPPSTARPSAVPMLFGESADPGDTALREAREEVGLDPAGVVSRLSDHVGWGEPWDVTRERDLPVTGGARR